MTDLLPVSIVIVSRNRPEALRRCLLAVSQLRYHPFEVVVVADAAGRAVVRGLPQAAYVKVVPFDHPGVSAARNLGVAEAAGTIVAFIDDDAVPEPSWLMHLVAPFQHDEVAATGGFVRGRNGISWQWQGRSVDRTGATHALDLIGETPTLLTATPDLAIKTEGTNMAVRRSVLVALGGFDAAFQFYLDETDLNLRLATEQMSTVLVPQAQVHHGYHASAHRRADRTPADLFEIGASWAVFLRKFCPEEETGPAWRRVRNRERRRLLDHMIWGRLEPRDVRRLMDTLVAGYAEGETRPSEWAVIADPSEPFRALPVDATGRSVLIAGRFWFARSLRQRALAEVAAGRIVTVLRLSPTALFHQVTFDPAGFWLQRGGIFGKSDRHQRPFVLQRFRTRVRKEAQRVRRERLLEALD